MAFDRLRISVLLADGIWILLALLLVCDRRFDAVCRIHAPEAFGSEFLCLLLLSLVVWPTLYFWIKLDGFEHGWGLTSVSSWLAIGVLLQSIVLGANAYFLRETFQRRFLLYTAVLLYAGYFAIRVLARWLLAWGAAVGVRRMVILGHGRVARELAAKISQHPELRTKVVGFFSVSGQNGRELQAPPLRGISTLEIPEMLQRQSITDVVIVFSGQSREVSSLVDRCRAAGMTVSLVSEYYDLYLTRPKLVEVGGIPLLRFDKPSEHNWLLHVKPAMDFLMAIGLLVVSVPLIALATLQLMLREGPMLESETRCGRNGRPFSMLRFAIAAEDPSNTWLMNFMVRTSLNELPALWNVLRGEMSIVGPRPETPERIKHYSEWHRQRLRFKPGITGWAQVHGSRDFDSSDEKARFDLHYILNWSPLLDIVVLLQTLGTILSRLRPRQWESGMAPAAVTAQGMTEHYADGAHSGSH
jgi:lipopolysaccharide/colanic/teichoic acid biosynthesis glycosyltransferase